MATHRVEHVWKPEKRETTASRVERQIKASVLNGVFQPGEFLGSENDLAALFSVSRLPIREAIGRLGSLGVVEVKPGAGGGVRIAEGDPTPTIEALAIQLALVGTSTRGVISAWECMQAAVLVLSTAKATAEDFAAIESAIAQTYYVEKMAPVREAMGRPTTQGLIGRSNAFREMLSLVARVAPSLATVLLLGESGTGKELVAQAVHASSTRAHKPLVVVDCASMPENLFESELFGHERGAFTGANVARAGLVEAASGGTLFLDEVGDIPLTIQVKLLRLLESGTYRRVGSTELRHADIRVVSATHRDLVQMVSQGQFREDLYYRLSTFPIHLPALRERKEDIPLLSSALMARIGQKHNLTTSAPAQHLLQAQDFPGNVRELRNLLERASLLCDGDALEASHLQQALKVGNRKLVSEHSTQGVTRANTLPNNTKLKEAERDAFLRLVESHVGSRAELARELGISPRSLYRKLKSVQ